jgi:hypothetical protein
VSPAISEDAAKPTRRAATNVIRLAEAKRRRDQGCRELAARLDRHRAMLDPWSAVFLRDLPAQRREVSPPQRRALEAITERLRAAGYSL